MDTCILVLFYRIQRVRRKKVDDFIVTDVEAPEDIVWVYQPFLDSYKLNCTAVDSVGTPISSDSLTFFFPDYVAVNGWRRVHVYYNYKQVDEAFSSVFVYFSDLKRMNTPSIKKAVVANGKVTAEIKPPKGVKPTKKDAPVLPKFYLVYVSNNDSYFHKIFTAEQIANPVEFELSDTSFVGGYIAVSCALDTYYGTAFSESSKPKFFGTYTKANAEYYTKVSGKDKVTLSWKAPKEFTHYEITIKDDYDFTKKYPSNFIYDFDEDVQAFYVEGKGKSISFNATRRQINFAITLWTADRTDSVIGYAFCHLPKAKFKKLFTATQGIPEGIVVTNTSPYNLYVSSRDFSEILQPYQSYTFSNVIPGDDYDFVAEVYDPISNEFLGYTSSVTGWAAFPPIDESNVVADKQLSFQEIKVTWRPVYGAEAYKVYRKSSILTLPFVGDKYWYNITEVITPASGWITNCQFVDMVNPVNFYGPSHVTFDYVVIPAKKGGKRAVDINSIDYSSYAETGAARLKLSGVANYSPGVEMHFASDSMNAEKGIWDEKWTGKPTVSAQYWDWAGKAPKLKKMSMKYLRNTDTDIVYTAGAEFPTYNAKHYKNALKSDIMTDSYFALNINTPTLHFIPGICMGIFSKLPGVDKKFAKSSFLADQLLLAPFPIIDSVSEYNFGGRDTVKLSDAEFIATGLNWGTKAPKAFIEYYDASKPAGKRVVQLSLKIEAILKDAKGKATFVDPTVTQDTVNLILNAILPDSAEIDFDSFETPKVPLDFIEDLDEELVLMKDGTINIDPFVHILIAPNSTAKFSWGKVKPPKGPANLIIKTSKGIAVKRINIVD